MSEIKNVGWTWMTLNTFKCNYLTPLYFKGLTRYFPLGKILPNLQFWYTSGQM